MKLILFIDGLGYGGKSYFFFYKEQFVEVAASIETKRYVKDVFSLMLNDPSYFYDISCTNSPHETVNFDGSNRMGYLDYWCWYDYGGMVLSKFMSIVEDGGHGLKRYAYNYYGLMTRTKLAVWWLRENKLYHPFNVDIIDYETFNFADNVIVFKKSLFMLENNTFGIRDLGIYLKLLLKDINCSALNFLVVTKYKIFYTINFLCSLLSALFIDAVNDCTRGMFFNSTAVTDIQCLTNDAYKNIYASHGGYFEWARCRKTSMWLLMESILSSNPPLDLLPIPWHDLY